MIKRGETFFTGILRESCGALTQVSISFNHPSIRFQLGMLWDAKLEFPSENPRKVVGPANARADMSTYYRVSERNLGADASGMAEL